MVVGIWKVGVVRIWFLWGSVLVVFLYYSFFDIKLLGVSMGYMITVGMFILLKL